MVKTQIQIPDELYRRVKQLAAAQEWSLAETLRRGAELLLASRPPVARVGTWSLGPPANTRLRIDPCADAAWREEANLGSSAARMKRRS